MGSEFGCELSSIIGRSVLEIPKQPERPMIRTIERAEYAKILLIAALKCDRLRSMDLMLSDLQYSSNFEFASLA